MIERDVTSQNKRQKTDKVEQTEEAPHDNSDVSSMGDITPQHPNNEDESIKKTSSDELEDYNVLQDSENSSHTSQLLLESIKETKILVSCILKHDGTLRFFINSKQRSDTVIKGGGEGDHTTAYTGIIQALISLTDNASVEDAIASIDEFGSLILKPDSLEEFKAIKSSVELLTHKDRVTVKDLLSKQVSIGFVDKVNKTLKMGKVAQLGSSLSEKISCFLTEIQKDEHTTYYSQGRIDKNADEGNIVKRAAYALLAADKLCKLCGADENEFEFEDRLEQFKLSLAKNSKNSDEEDHIIRYGITKLAGIDKGVYADALMSKLNNAQEIGQKKLVIIEAQKDLIIDNMDIYKLIADLFDYKKNITFDLEKAAPLSKQQLKNCTNEGDKRLDLIKEIFKENKHEIGNIIIEGQKQIITITRTDESDLIEVLSKHLKIIKAAFPNLYAYLNGKSVSQSSACNEEAKTKFDEVVDLFLKHGVIENGGWDKAKESATLPTGLTIEHLKKEIKAMERERMGEVQLNVVESRQLEI